MRYAAVAGTFYPSDSAKLKELISNCFKKGAGLPKARDNNKEIKAVISPHAGFVYSGVCASFAYKTIAESKFPDVFIILGTNHQSFDTCLCDEDFETPLGIVKNDKEFSKALNESGVLLDNDIHADEHSIEVQLPFLQTVFNSDIKIVPILVSQDFEGLAERIVSVAKKLRRSFIVIASSDFTHYGANYDFVPFEDDVKKNLYKLDKDAIDFILKLDDKGFIEYVKKTGATICGFLPITVLIRICRLIKAKDAKLMNYYTSGDVVGDYSNAVGYAAIVIK